MAEISDFSTTDASNTTVGWGWPENMTPSSVNNAARADLGIIARFYQDISGGLTSTGSSNAYALALNRGDFALDSDYDGYLIGFIANHASTGAATLNVTPNGGSALGAVPLRKFHDVAIASGDIEDGMFLLVQYEHVDGTTTNDRFQIVSTLAGSAYDLVGDTTPQLGGDLDLNGHVINDVWTTGDVKVTFKTTADTGWVMMDDGTIGSAASGATTRANADTEDLYTLLWTNISDTYAPVTGGRGASAAADFAADKPMALPKALGRALAVSGEGSGLTARSLGETVGAETHTLTDDELPSLSGTVQFAFNNGANGCVSSANGVFTAGTSSTGHDGGSGGSRNSAFTLAVGSDDPHNNMQPTAFFNVMVKL